MTTQLLFFFLILVSSLQSNSMQHSQSLLYFCEKQDLENVKRCVEEEQQDINQTDGLITPLIQAVKNENITIVRYLLEKGASVHMLLEDHYSQTAFYTAAIWGYLEIMQLLYGYDVDIQKENAKDNLMCKICYALNHTYDFHTRDTFTRTLINYHPIIKQLIEWKINLIVQDNCGLTPLHYLVQYANETDICLIQSFLDAEVSVDIQAVDQSTPLMRACAAKNSPIAQFLLVKNANVHAKDEKEETALFYGMDNPKIMRILLSYGADLNHKNKTGNTVLHEDIYKNRYKKYNHMRILFSWFENPDNHININAQNNDGDTPLHYAAEYQAGYDYILALLFFYSANPTLKNNQGKTPTECCSNDILTNRKKLLTDKPNNGKKRYSFTSHDRWTEEQTRCYSLCEFEKKEILPFLLTPKESAQERDAFRHNALIQVDKFLNINPTLPCEQVIILQTDNQEEYKQNLATWEHYHNEEYKNKEKPRFNILDRLRKREYGKRMQEQLYIEG